MDDGNRAALYVEDPVALEADRLRLRTEISAHFGVPGTQVEISRYREDKDLPDTTFKFRVGIGPAGGSYFLHLSPVRFPAAISDTFARARAMANHLGEAGRAHVLLPAWESAIDGRSFALTPTLQRISTGRLLGRGQCLWLGRHVYDWLELIVGETLREVGSEVIGGHLQRLVDMSLLDPRLRRAAAQAQELFLGSRLRPVTAMNHRDLWTGNVLFRGGVLSWWPTRQFAVIDWGAATVDAAPGYDAVKFALDAKMPRRYAKARFAQLSRVIGCAPADFPHYVLASLGALACELDNWPEAAFREECARNFDHAVRVCA